LAAVDFEDSGLFEGVDVPDRGAFADACEVGQAGG
jgi:hypothetical protein